MTLPLSFRAEGSHLLADLSGVEPAKLMDCTHIEALLRTAASAARTTILHSHFHAFGAGQGITGVVLLAESHISIHTWPEQRFAAVDIFMCGNSRPEEALAVVRAALMPADCQVQTIRRMPAQFILPEH